ncbi:MAG: AtpZ/AtpI family protein [Acidobacteriia bacterium]|nr:AtpZ/AtpI family protein [Terriglobia bacterium]
MADSKKPIGRQVADYTALALLLPASTFVGYILGHWLDKVFGTHFLYIVFLLLGIVAGFVKLIQQIVRDPGNES